ncbi:MAG: heavy metal-binding domain-containing protein [Phycisphaerales bacterium]
MYAGSRTFILSTAAFALTCAAAPARAQHDHGASKPTPGPAAPVAERYFCPMHCEGTKVYDKPGKCPVCKMNLKKQTSDLYTVAVREVSADGGAAITAGKAASLVFKIKNPTGLQITKVETVHEKPLHLLIVSKDLSWFRHEHPAMQQDGTFTLNFTFAHGGEYTLYHDFTPLPDGGAKEGPGQQIVPVAVTVEGTPAAPVPVKLVEDSSAPKAIDGYTVALTTGEGGGGEGVVKSGGSATLTFTIGKDGTPVTTLAPYLGAMGHLVVLSADGKEFVHSHPKEGHDDHAMTSGGPTVAFEAHFKKPGLYKAWGQFNVGSKDKETILTAPFVFKVEAGEPTHEHHDHK